MKILFLAHRIPYPPNKGEKIRAFNEIKHLSRKYEVHLVAFCDKTDLQYSKQLEQYCSSVTLIPMTPWLQKLKAGMSILRNEPFTLGYFSSNQMRQAVRRKLEEHQFSLMLVYCSSMARYVERIAQIPKVLDFVDSDACKWGQYASARKRPAKWLYSYEARRLHDFELSMVAAFDRCLFVSDREARHIPAGLQSKVAFIKNGVDLDFYQPAPPCRGERTIVFTGAMDYFPNVDAVTFFAAEVFPRIQQVFSDARFVIVGSRPAQSVLELAKAPGVTVTGTVDDVRPFLAAATVAVVPLRISQGIQNKILEALAAGRPVVASPLAAGGLVPMQHIPLVVAEDPEEFAARVCEFFRRPPASAEEQDQCRRQLKQHYDWKANMGSLEKIIDQLIPTADSPAAGLDSLGPTMRI